MSPTESFPERIVPDETEPGIVAIHLKRYEFARPHCTGKVVLDAACGVGYGSNHLATGGAGQVTGVELDPATLAYAKGRYAAPNLTFVEGDVTALHFPDETFDVACSFETIEHVADPGRALAELARVLRPDGLLVVSTPHVPVTNRAPSNPHHRVELSPGDLARLLEERFSDVELFGQRRLQSQSHRLAQRLDIFGLRRRVPFLRRGARLLGTAPMAELTLDDIAIERDAIEGASEIVALCRRPRR